MAMVIIMNGVLHCETKIQKGQYFMGLLVKALLKKMSNSMGAIALTYKAYCGHPYLKMIIGGYLIVVTAHLLNPFTSVGFSCNMRVRFQNKVRFESFASCFFDRDQKYQLELIA